MTMKLSIHPSIYFDPKESAQGSIEWARGREETWLASMLLRSCCWLFWASFTRQSIRNPSKIHPPTAPRPFLDCGSLRVARFQIYLLFWWPKITGNCNVTAILESSQRQGEKQQSSAASVDRNSPSRDINFPKPCDQLDPFVWPTRIDCWKHFLQMLASLPPLFNIISIHSARKARSCRLEYRRLNSTEARVSF